MKTTYKHLLRAALGLFALGAWAPDATAQVKGISYSISPVGDYQIWEKKTGISDGFMVGGHLGFGFGEFVELRGTYLQSLDMKRNFGPLDLKELQGVELSQPDIDVTRWGGDLKLNLSRGSVVPYLTAGTGVQTFKSDSLATFKNIYVSLGAGLQFVVADRYTLGVQAVNTSFNTSPVNNLTTAAERTANGIDAANYGNELLDNWSVRASLSFYLGGRRPGELTEIDKAYLNNFSGGFSLPIEITAGQLDFGKALPYANTKYVGAATGINFGPFVGLRGYYWRAMDEDYFSSFDKLAIYGGEGKFKLSNGRGLTPSINVGGGVIDAMEGYMVDGVELDEKNRPFVSGGLGLDIPFGRTFKLTAYGKALLTSNDPLENVANPDELSTSWAYGLSANLIIGNGAKPVQTEKEASYDEMVKNSLKRELNRAEDLKEGFQNRADKLDDAIKDAREDGNRRLANDLEDQKAALEEAVDRIGKLLKEERTANEEATRQNDPLLMKMKPTEFGSAIDRIEDNVPNARRSYDLRDSDRNENRDAERNNDNNSSESNAEPKRMEELQNRLKSIEQKLDNMQRENDDYRRNVLERRENYLRNNPNYNSQDDRNGNYQNNPNYNNQGNPNYHNQDFRQNNNKPGVNSPNRNFNSNGDNSQSAQVEAMKAERQKSEELKAAYEDRVRQLEKQVKEAQDQGDAKAEEERAAEMKAMQEGIDKIRTAQQKQDRTNQDAYQRNDPAQLRMSSDQFRSEIENVEQSNDQYREQVERSMEDTRRQYDNQIRDMRNDRDAYQREMEDEMDALRKEIRELKYNRPATPSNALNENNGSKSPDTSIQKSKNAVDGSNPAGETEMDETDTGEAFLSPHIATTGFFSDFHYDGTAALAGVSLGKTTTFNVGVRSYYRYKDTQLSVAPEAFFGVGGSSTFGLFLNGIYDIKLNRDDVVPYAGLGLGVMKVGDSEDNNTKLGLNIVLGANLLKVGNGRFFADVTARNFFKYTQLAVGYRLPF